MHMRTCEMHQDPDQHMRKMEHPFSAEQLGSRTEVIGILFTTAKHTSVPNKLLHAPKYLERCHGKPTVVNQAQLCTSEQGPIT